VPEVDAMRRIITAAVVTLGILAPASQADVVVRGPLGRVIVIVPAPVDVRVGQPVYVGRPAPAMPKTPAEPVVVSKFIPAVRPADADSDGEALPPPKVLPGSKVVAGSKEVPPPPQPIAVAPIHPRDFAKMFKPAGGTYEVLFLHPISKQAMSIVFDLPPGNPRVSYCCNSLLFDYGRHEVEIRFQLGNKVKVTAR
jgi:hypothetical protein